MHVERVGDPPPDKSVGAMNLYATKTNAFSNDDVLDGGVLPAHAAVALAASLEEDHLHRGLDTTRAIGEAIGILRERYGLTSDQAFGVLRRVSSQQNLKLRRVAQELVSRGSMPLPEKWAAAEIALPRGQDQA